MSYRLILCSEFTRSSSLHVVNIYFTSPTYDRISMDAKVTLQSVVSAVGGILGLFTGFSILSGVEILYFLGRVISRRFDIYRSRAKKTKKLDLELLLKI